MFLRVVFFCVLSLTLSSHGQDFNTRNVYRSGHEGAINLVEFNVRDVIYGRCSFYNDGENVLIYFEERDGEVQARSENPTILDPIAKAEACRNAASQKPVNQPAFRSGSYGEAENGETSQDIARRFSDFEREMKSNYEYASYLRPRLQLTTFTPLFSSNVYALTFGAQTNNKTFPLLSFPQKVQSQTTFGFGGFPFKNLGKK